MLLNKEDRAIEVLCTAFQVGRIPDVCPNAIVGSLYTGAGTKLSALNLYEKFSTKSKDYDGLWEFDDRL